MIPEPAFPGGRTGNRGTGTNNYGSYGRDHEIHCLGKPVIAASSDPTFRGDPNRYNPEELLVASISSCHMLWYLHLCADAGITVTAYEDSAEGRMEESDSGSGRFTEVMLRPTVTIAVGADAAMAERLHAKPTKNVLSPTQSIFQLVTPR